MEWKNPAATPCVATDLTYDSGKPEGMGEGAVYVRVLVVGLVVRIMDTPESHIFSPNDKPQGRGASPRPAGGACWTTLPLW